MRGRFRSRTIESIVREAENLAGEGVRELNLVAQDSTMYGSDLGNRHGLANLIRRLNEVEGLTWIRFLYAYPNSIYDELLDAIAECQRVCKYIDMPLQHASREVLKRMKRGGHRSSLTKLIEKIRLRIPQVTMRTTMIVGFPGETDSDFEELLDFVREVQFDRLGVFTYSDEEDCSAYRLEGKVPEATKKERMARLMKAQSKISKARNQRLKGQVLPILVDGISPETELLWGGRLESQAPEIDGVVYVNDGIDATVLPGQLRQVLITEAHEYDLVGGLVA